MKESDKSTYQEFIETFKQTLEQRAGKQFVSTFFHEEDKREARRQAVLDKARIEAKKEQAQLLAERQTLVKPDPTQPPLDAILVQAPEGTKPTARRVPIYRHGVLIGHLG